MVEGCEAVELTTAPFVTAAAYNSAAARLPDFRARTWLVYLMGCLLLFGMAGSMADLLAGGDSHVSANTAHRVFGTYWASGDAANRGANPTRHSRSPSASS